MKNSMRTYRYERGFIALMATIVIAAILLVLAVQSSVAGYHARFNILGTEAKEQASALAQGCADQALSSIMTNPTFTGDVVMSTEAGTCEIYPIEFNTPAAGIVTIKTQAEVRGSFANLEMRMNMGDIRLDASPAAPTKGTIIVITNVVNDGSGTRSASDFTMRVAANSPSQSAFAGDEGGVPVTVDPGSYNVTEDALADYATLISTNCAGTIGAGDIKFCTITNNDITTSLTVLVNVVNDNGGTKTVSDFPLTINGTAVTAGTRTTMTAGNHTVAITLPANYAASAWGYQCSATGNVTLAAGDNKTCIVNVGDNPPPAPSCADTVMILDRTGSMSSTDLSNERAAANALVNLYAGVLPPALPPRMGVGSIGAYPNQSLPNGAAGIPTLGQLSSAYTNLTTVIGQMMSGNSSVGSNLAAGINAASAELSSTRHVAGNKKVMIMVSDGDPNSPSGNTNGSVTLAANAESATSAAWNTNTGTKVPAIAANDGDTTYITPSAMTQSYGLVNASIPGNAINISVTLHAVAKRASGSNASFSFIAERAGTSATGNNIVLTNNYVDYTWTMASNPLGGSWTVAEVNNWTTNFGVLNTSAVGSVPRITQMYATVSYAIPGSANSQKSPTTATSPNQWTNPTRVNASDNSYATSNVEAQQQSFNGFGFSIPSGSTITGIQVTTEARISGTASADTTATLYPDGQGNGTAWSNGSSVIDETGSPNCASFDSIITGVANNRESVTLDISTIPDGSIINSIAITAYDRQDSSSGGTYKTYARVNGTNIDAGSNLTTSSVGGFFGCSSGKTQTISLSVTKGVGTTLEAGVLKVSGSGSANNAVRVGALNAVITYTPPSGGTLGISLSPNNGGTWTSTKNVTLSTPEGVASPSGNSSSDTWGRTWNASEFNNGNFLLRVQNNALSGITTSLDQVVVNVFYTSGSTSTSPSLVPDTVGSFNNWPATSGASEAAVGSNDGDATYITNTLSTQGTQSFTFGNAGIPSNATNIQVVAHAIAKEVGGSSGNIRIVAERGATQVADGGRSLSSSYSDYTWNMSTNPLGGSWTVSEVNNWTTSFGVRDNSTSGTTPRVTNMYLVVTYTVNSTPAEAALTAADTAKLGPDGINGTEDDTDIFTIHFGSDPGPYNGRKLLANLASGNAAVSGHQNGSVADAGGVVSGDSGFLAPTVATTPNQWTNPTRAFASDNSYATNATNGNQQGFTNFGLTVPPTASVVGIAIDVEAKSADSSGCQVGADISWDNGTTFTATTLTANISGNDNVYTLGGSTNLWGRAWTPANFLNGSFVVRLKNIDPGSSCSNNSLLSVDRMRARVYHSVNTENGDGDNFFISPSSADMKDIFTYIGEQVCPAAGFVGSANPPTEGTVTVVTQVINNNGGSKTPADVPTTVTGASSPSPSSFAGTSAGQEVTMAPGNYSIRGTVPDGYTEIASPTCTSADSGGIVAGEYRVCVLTYDDVPPPPPPPNYTINLGSWQEIPTVNP